VDACPAQALTGEAWTPDVPREAILDVRACDRWKRAHYFHYHRGHNCGICSAVCPFGLKVLKRDRTIQRQISRRPRELTEMPPSVTTSGPGDSIARRS
jgi:epoxyqueuosine reductase QueG